MSTLRVSTLVVFILCVVQTILVLLGASQIKPDSLLGLLVRCWFVSCPRYSLTGLTINQHMLLSGK